MVAESGAKVYPPASRSDNERIGLQRERGSEHSIERAPDHFGDGSAADFIRATRIEVAISRPHARPFAARSATESDSSTADDTRRAG
jgi:hypothetical protein